MKNILITGGAGGIGSAIAKEFISQGFRVYSLDLTSKDLGEYFINVKCDVTSYKDLKDAKQQLNGIKFSHIITLAGRALDDEWKSFEDISEQTINNSIMLNLCGQLMTIKIFLTEFDKQKDVNSIILVSSINAYGGFGLPVYSSAKAGLIGFCKSVYPQLKEKGISKY